MAHLEPIVSSPGRPAKQQASTLHLTPVAGSRFVPRHRIERPDAEHRCATRSGCSGAGDITIRVESHIADDHHAGRA